MFSHDLSLVAHASFLRLFVSAYQLGQSQRKNRDSSASAQLLFNHGNPIRDRFCGLFPKGPRELLCIPNCQSPTKTLSIHM